jgi:hypothetical protein
VLKDGFVQLGRETRDGERRLRRVLGGAGGLPTTPVQLRDGRWLRITITLRLDETAEAVIRMLIDDFTVPAATPDDVWRPVLAASEGMFREIAHQG